MTLTADEKRELVTKFGKDETDTGATEVQIAMLTRASTTSPSTCASTSTITTRAAAC